MKMFGINELEARQVRAGGAHRRVNLLWLVVGTAVSLLAVDARWDLPIAAWIAPVLMLRFSRTSIAPLAMAGIVAASFLQLAMYLFEMGAPFNATALAICAVLGLFFSLPFLLDRLLSWRLGPVASLFLLPVAMAMAEFAAANVLPVGASIGTRAITQTENLALVQVISVFGPYVISFLIGLAATVANHIWETPTKTALAKQGGAFSALLLAVVVFGEVRLAYAANYFPGDTVTVAGIVPPMALHTPAWSVSPDKYPATPETIADLSSPEMKSVYKQVHEDLLSRTRMAAAAGAQIIMWSETAAPLAEADKASFLGEVADLARSEDVYINTAIGVPYERNETFLIGPDGEQEWHYRKNYPVPGLEPVAPFRNAVPVLDTPFGRLSNVICYDGDFPALVRVPADILLVPAFDSPKMGYVHTMRMTRLRSIENGFSIVRTDYLGVSAAFDPFGRVLAMQNTAAGNAHTMIVDVPIKGVATLYSIIGDAFGWLCAAATLLLIGAAVIRPTRA